MADEKQLLSSVDWQDTFSFTHLFRGFRLAIHPGKLVLALLGLAICMIAGFVLDALWYGGSPIIWDQGRPQEIKVFAAGQQGDLGFPSWRERQTARRETALKDLRDREFELDADEVSINSAGLASHFIAVLEQRLDKYLDENNLDSKLKAIDERYKNQPERKREARTEAKQDVPQDLLDKNREFQARTEQIRDLVGTGPSGRGPFRALLRYERGVFDKVVTSSVQLNLLGGLGVTAAAEAAGPGVVVQIGRGLKGLQWLLVHHTLYFIIFGIICLAVWGIAGGAISRIAALHIARDEKISINQALSFSIRKFPSFVFAPLIPAAIIAVVGFIIWVGTLILCNIPGGVGAFLNSVFFFLPLIAGLVIALISIGTVGGISLMFPTIAVEGSDSFDAISRSFSYIYAKPWRMAFYSLVALIYGVLCYLFVRFFAFLVLKLTHIAVSLGVLADGSSGIVNSFKTMWPGPKFSDLHGGFDFGAASGIETFGAWVIAFWVYIVIGFVAAFLISFFFSANSMIYYLLRKKVDATDMDDVYVEEEPAEEIPPIAEAPAEPEEAEPEKTEEPAQGESDQGKESSEDEDEEKTE